MIDFLDWLTNEPFRLWTAIAIGSLIGLAAAYARERENARTVNLIWFRNRLLLYPFLGLATATFAEMTKSSRTLTAFIAAMLALLSFDALRIIQSRFERRLGNFIEPSRDDDKPK